MNWQSIKSASEITLVGIKVDSEKHNNGLRMIELTDSEGNKLRFTSSYSDLIVMIPAKPIMKDAFLLKGEFRGIKVKELLQTEREAKDRLSEITENQIYQGHLEVEKVSVAVSDSGELPQGEYIPF